MFTRNKMVGWSAVIFAVQGWLNETPGQLASGKQPAYFSVGMSVMALGMVCFYSFLFFFAEVSVVLTDWAELSPIVCT